MPTTRCFSTAFASSLLAIAPFRVAGTAPVNWILPSTAAAAVNEPSTRARVEPVEVAPGCQAPASASFRHAYFVDPARGSDAGDGTRAHPWGRLEDVLSSPGGRFGPGDVLYLFNGDHGNVLASAKNTAFVEVTAAPGQTPVLESLRVTGSRWRFSHLKIQSLKGVSKADYGRALVSISGPASDIILDSNTVSPQDDVSTWSSADWKSQSLKGLVVGGSSVVSCVTIARNKFYNDGGGSNGAGGSSVALFANHALLSHNVIDNFADDAIQFGGNDVELVANTITNNVGLEDGNHNDGIQGFVPGSAAYKDIHTFTNVIIKDNIIIRQTRADLHDPTALQGIDNFSSSVLDWYNVEVVNNVVVTNAYHGITFGAVHHATISHNTVLADRHPTRQLISGFQGINTVPGNMVWIFIQGQVNNVTTPGGGSSDVLVADNVAQTMKIESGAARVRDNVIFGSLELMNNGIAARFKVPGVYGEHNTFDPSLIGEFQDFKPEEFRYDIRLKSSSRLAGEGAVPMLPIGGATIGTPDPG